MLNLFAATGMFKTFLFTKYLPYDKKYNEDKSSCKYEYLAYFFFISFYKFKN